MEVHCSSSSSFSLSKKKTLYDYCVLYYCMFEDYDDQQKCAFFFFSKEKVFHSMFRVVNKLDRAESSKIEKTILRRPLCVQFSFVMLQREVGSYK